MVRDGSIFFDFCYILKQTLRSHMFYIDNAPRKRMRVREGIEEESESKHKNSLESSGFIK